MINYFYKYLELLDTVFLALKKKPLGTTRAEYTFIPRLLTTLCSIPPRIPPFSNCASLLHSAQWENKYRKFVLRIHDSMRIIDYLHSLGSLSHLTSLCMSSCV